MQDGVMDLKILMHRHTKGDIKPNVLKHKGNILMYLH